MPELASLIHERARKRGLSVSFEKMQYAGNVFLESLPQDRFKNALFIGVGHGHDALLSLANGNIERVVGVDPYIESDGNGDEDYRDLIEAIRDYGLGERFAVHKATIEEFLDYNNESFDLIVIADVLHHIFVTRDRLVKSSLFDDARSLFRSLKEAAPGGYLAISDVQRYGLRPWATRLGILKGNVNYATKQSHWQWDRAIVEAGWARIGMKNYIPYRLRNLSPLLGGNLGRWTICSKYFLYYKNDK